MDTGRALQVQGLGRQSCTHQTGPWGTGQCEPLGTGPAFPVPAPGGEVIKDWEKDRDTGEKSGALRGKVVCIDKYGPLWRTEPRGRRCGTALLQHRPQAKSC